MNIGLKIFITSWVIGFMVGYYEGRRQGIKMESVCEARYNHAISYNKELADILKSKGKTSEYILDINK